MAYYRKLLNMTGGRQSMRRFARRAIVPFAALVYFTISLARRKKTRDRPPAPASEPEAIVAIYHLPGEPSLYTALDLRRDMRDYITALALETGTLSPLLSGKIFIPRDITLKMYDLPEVKGDMSRFFNAVFEELGLPCRLGRCLYHASQEKRELEVKLTDPSWIGIPHAVLVAAKVSDQPVVN